MTNHCCNDCKVAQELGISDVDMIVVCRNHNVPKPPKGYWSMVAHGRQVERPPLPPLADGASDIIKIAPGRAPVAKAPKAATPAAKPIAGVTVKPAEPPIPVSDTLRSPHPLVERTPRRPGIRGDGDAASSGLVDAVGRGGVRGDGVGVVLRAGLPVLPRLAAVARDHHPAQLDADVERLLIDRVHGDPAHVVGVGPGRERPGRGAGQLAQCRRILPGRAIVLGAQQPARLGPGIDD